MYMRKFIISEEERKHIKGLYEQTSTHDFYSTLVGYLVKLDKDGGKKGIRGVEDIASIREARVYFEHLRDGKTPPALSEAGKFVKEYAMTETKKLSGQDLVALMDIGKTTKSKM